MVLDNVCEWIFLEFDQRVGVGIRLFVNLINISFHRISKSSCVVLSLFRTLLMLALILVVCCGCCYGLGKKVMLTLDCIILTGLKTGFKHTKIVGLYMGYSMIGTL